MKGPKIGRTRRNGYCSEEREEGGGEKGAGVVGTGALLNNFSTKSLTVPFKSSIISCLKLSKTS